MAKTKVSMFYQFGPDGIYIGPVEVEECPKNATSKTPPLVGDMEKSAWWNAETEEWKIVSHADLIKATEIRTLRDKFLASSDWTQLPDTAVDKEAWGMYREELRDITRQKGFPSEVVWPEAPSLLKKASEKK